MRAAILTSFGSKFEIVDDVELDEPQEGEVVVRITHCGVCHSDQSVWEGLNAHYPLPAILGHEAAGIISAVGPGVVDRSVGQHVILTMRAPCGICFQCSAGNPVLCETPPATASRGPRAFWQGKPVHRGFNLGAFAEFALVDVGGTVPIDAESSMEMAAVVGCAVQTGMGAVRNVARVTPGSHLLVIGAGSVGISVVLAGRLAGAASIAVVDPNEGRRAQALALGASHAFDSADPEVDAAIRALSGGRGVDYVFDLVSVDTTFQLALKASRPGAEIILIGVPGGTVGATLPTGAFVVTQKAIKGCMLGNCHPQRDLPHFLELGESGSLAINRLITARRPLVEINEAFEDLVAGRGLRTIIGL